MPNRVVDSENQVNVKCNEIASTILEVSSCAVNIKYVPRHQKQMVLMQHWQDNILQSWTNNKVVNEAILTRATEGALVVQQPKRESVTQPLRMVTKYAERMHGLNVLPNLRNSVCKVGATCIGSFVNLARRLRNRSSESNGIALKRSKLMLSDWTAPVAELLML